MVGDRGARNGAGRPQEVVTILQHERVSEAARRMYENRIGCLVVVDDGGCLVGIISERDILGWVGKATPETYRQRVLDVMAREVVTGEPGIGLQEAQERMSRNGIRHLPLVSKGIPVGMVSLRDVAAGQVAERAVPCA
jgi:CBS domain-containing protein